MRISLRYLPALLNRTIFAMSSAPKLTKQATLNRFLNLKSSTSSQATLDSLFAKQTRAQEKPDDVTGSVKRRSPSSEPEINSEKPNSKKPKTRVGLDEGSSTIKEKVERNGSTKSPKKILDNVSPGKVKNLKASPKNITQKENPLEISDDHSEEAVKESVASRKKVKTIDISANEDPQSTFKAPSSVKDTGKSKGEFGCPSKFRDRWRLIRFSTV
ncbi:hypothetical protein CROQUDRAFT_420996 [Cronartium quercuum f. sp. fusiforme G11]|uniref:Uncharacterized protein n=1 Tax=Cronartium quercuum f. sp. fusiforme G11 TaxID=708437 RepID=A0A9P6NQ83_9BASI|nr:hypothetical protein CROQUDRAFT_420996 [Cronartium quercuum f. sp. fusiforme G11]